MSSHKPRKKQSISNQTRPTFPLTAFFWSVKGSNSQWLTLPVILMVNALFRWAVSLWEYSGFQSPPMHGDFEAQRHWLEITTHLPVSRWYFYDLQWWGLDYPPLTAYHSWVLGKIGSYINPSWFELDISRGLDDPDLKIYMRASVLVSEYLIYIPAIVVLVRRLTRLEHNPNWDSWIALTAILMQPATMLIDHGHFQYNTVMLGFSAAAISNLIGGKVLPASAFFVGALGFKQMALFYAPAIFAYLLGTCVFPKISIIKFMLISIVTALTFASLFIPLLLGGMYDNHRKLYIQESIKAPLLGLLPFTTDPKNILHVPIILLAQSVHRIFPFARGLFEDKVANVWCAIHTFHKLHVYSTGIVQRAALFGTLAAIIPPCVILFLKPRRDIVPLGFAATGWGFFLFSYQVHEKNVLLPLLPMTILLAAHDGLTSYVRSWVGFANILGCWTMFPLLKRDGLQTPYFVMTLLWAYLLDLPLASVSSSQWLTLIIHVPIYLTMIVWHGVEAFVAPPKNKPDLWTVMNVLIGATGFSICYIWCIWSMMEKIGWIGKTVPRSKKTQ